MTILFSLGLVIGCFGILTTLLARDWIAALWATAYALSQLQLLADS